MKYVLMQKDIGEQIKIIDNSTNLGKKKVENLIIESYKCIGTLESEQPPQRLLRGFNKDFETKLDLKDKQLFDIEKIIRG